jgi:hypothetical protein
MKMKPTRNPIPFIDADGCDCLRVPLAGNRGDAIIDAYLLPTLQAAGLRDGWSFNRAGNARYRYVRGHLSGHNTITVARLITGAQRGQHVCYRDGNPLNLRESNLYLVRGRAKTDCAALFSYCCADACVPDDAKSLAKTSERTSTAEADYSPPDGYRLVYSACIKINIGARS